MKVNLAHDSTSTDRMTDMVFSFIEAIINEYGIGDDSSDRAVDFFVSEHEGMQIVTEWMKDRHNLTATPFSLTTENGITLCFGFDFVEDEHLTKYLLTL